MEKKSPNKNRTILEILDGAHNTSKTADKGNNSLRGGNRYAKQFISEHVEARQALNNLKTQITGSTKLESILEKMSSNIEIFFDANTSKSERASTKQKIFRIYKMELESELSQDKPIVISDDLFPLEIFHDTRGYLEIIAKQAAGSYDSRWYDASAVMIRRLIETLIIECFETHKISDKIKNGEDNFYFLEILIAKMLDEHGKSWNLSRNCKTALPLLKKIGDQSAHSRTFNARKPDIDKNKDDLRIVTEELLTISKLKK